MAGKSKIVKKAEKASVRASATSPSMASTKPGQMITESVKRNRLAKAAKGQAKDASGVPGSPYQRKTGKKTPKALAKRVNQSIVARGGSPRPLYTSKAKAAEISARSAKYGTKKQPSKFEGSNPKPTKKAGNPNLKHGR